MLLRQEGIIKVHGLFKDFALEERPSGPRSEMVYTGKLKERLCLVLDCLTIHDFSCKNMDLINLQHYVIREKKLDEKEAIMIFYNIVRIVEALHERNIVHRDLKLGNLVLNQRTHRVTITNFCLGKHLTKTNSLLTDQKGSPAYISPDVLSGKPYAGKPSDMWALGVVLYTMLYGQFPFYDSNPTVLFQKIKATDFVIPISERVNTSTVLLIKGLLTLDPNERFTATRVLQHIKLIVTELKSPFSLECVQIVPDIDDKLKTNDNEKNLKDEAESLGTTTFSDNKVMSSKDKVNESRPFGVQIPVQQIGQDARAVTTAELLRFQHFLSLGSSVHASHFVEVPTPQIAGLVDQQNAGNHSHNVSLDADTSGNRTGLQRRLMRPARFFPGLRRSANVRTLCSYQGGPQQISNGHVALHCPVELQPRVIPTQTLAAPTNLMEIINGSLRVRRVRGDSPNDGERNGNGDDFITIPTSMVPVNAEPVLRSNRVLMQSVLSLMLPRGTAERESEVPNSERVAAILNDVRHGLNPSDSSRNYQSFPG
ncbi:AMP-activated protein kinase alpha subunit [Carabus blaptoides fortunei]